MSTQEQGVREHGSQEAVPRYADRLSLEGKSFVVLGAGQGMGLQVSHALAQQGARLLCVDLDAAKARAAAQATGAECLAADVTQRDEMRRILSHAVSRFGSSFFGVVDIVGAAHGRALADMSDADWQAQFDIVLTHAYLAIQYGAPLLAQRGGGSMVFLGSIAGLGARSGRMMGYGVAKAALNQLVRGAALEWAHRGVRMNVVAPGLTRTPRLLEANGDAFWAAQAREIPLGRPAETADVASAVLFFCSDLSAHVTATILPVDGGSHALNQSSYIPAATQQVKQHQ